MPEIIHEAIEVLDKTVMHCAQMKDPGLYHSCNRIYFISDGRDTTSKILLSENVARQRHTAAIERIGEGVFAFWYAP